LGGNQPVTPALTFNNWLNTSNMSSTPLLLYELEFGLKDVGIVHQIERYQFAENFIINNNAVLTYD
jgi:hypothetical protein